MCAWMLHVCMQNRLNNYVYSVHVRLTREGLHVVRLQVQHPVQELEGVCPGLLLDVHLGVSRACMVQMVYVVGIYGRCIWYIW